MESNGPDKTMELGGSDKTMELDSPDKWAETGSPNGRAHNGSLPLSKEDHKDDWSGQTKEEEEDQRLLKGQEGDIKPFSGSNGEVTIEMTRQRKMIYRVSDNPPFYLAFIFALQQSLLSIPKCLTVVAVLSDLVCAKDLEAFKARMFSTTLLMAGLCTVFQNTFGVRLPVYQGPTSSYIISILSLMSIPEWKCPSYWTFTGQIDNATVNGSVEELSEVYTNTYVLPKIQVIQGSLMLAGLIHMMIGMTGFLGFLMRFIGPLTVVPTLLLGVFKWLPIMASFMETSWIVSSLSFIVILVLGLYLEKKTMKIPLWNYQRGWYTINYPLHTVLSFLIAMVFGWVLSIILTAANVLSDVKGQPEYYARSDTRTYVIGYAPWFYVPYPEQFGRSSFSPGMFVCFLVPTLVSILDSIADYYACARTVYAPPPPQHAINRGIMIEGGFGILAGLFGACHATTTYATNIGLVGMTKVGSRLVFQLFGLQMLLTALIAKFGAFFVTIPYSVLGGTQLIGAGVFTGLLLANLQYVDMKSTRNLSVVGVALALGYILPLWSTENQEQLKTGNKDVDDLIIMLMTNPNLFGGIVACFLDNTLPGTMKDRGMVAWGNDDGAEDEEKLDEEDYEETLEMYEMPWMTKLLKRIPFNQYIPIFPTYKQKQN